MFSNVQLVPELKVVRMCSPRYAFITNLAKLRGKFGSKK